MPTEWEPLRTLIRQALVLSDEMGLLVVGARLSEALAVLDPDEAGEDSVTDPVVEERRDGSVPDGGDL